MSTKALKAELERLRAENAELTARLGSAGADHAGSKRQRGAAGAPGDDDDDTARVEWERMASVTRRKGSFWPTHLAHLLADRGWFAVVEEKKRSLAVLLEGEHKWKIEDGKGKEVPNAIDAAVARLREDLCGFDPCAYEEDNEQADADTLASNASRFETTLDTDEALRNKWLPLLMIKKNRMLEPKTDRVFCQDGMAVKDGSACKIVPDDYCVRTTGFPSTALLLEPEGFSAWLSAWRATKNSKIVDLVLASALFCGRPVRGDLNFRTPRMQNLVAETAGDYEICTPGCPYTLSIDPPADTSASFLARAAQLVRGDLASLPSAAGSSGAPAGPDLFSVVQLASNAPPDVHASHILYSCLRTSQVARDDPLDHIVKMLVLKDMLEPAGRYRSRKELERILNLTFTNPPTFVDGNLNARISAKGLVLAGVTEVKYIESEVPRSWQQLPMKESDNPTTALIDSEDDEENED
jgi:hypothetical protein